MSSSLKSLMVLEFFPLLSCSRERVILTNWNSMHMIFFPNLNLMLVNFTKRKLHSSRTKSRCLSLLSDIDRVQVSSFLGALNWHWIEYCSMIVGCFRHSLICQINPGQTRLYRTISFRQMKDRCPLERTDEPQGNVSCHILCKP